MAFQCFVPLRRSIIPALRGSAYETSGLSLRAKHHLAGLLGADIRHSVLPKFFVSCWQHGGEDGDVHLFDLNAHPQRSINDVLAEIRRRPFQGCAVTMPCKEAVMVGMDDLTLDACQVGSVNFIRAVRTIGRPVQLVGHNFDWSGIRYALHSKSITRVVEPVCVLGAGGVSRAAVYALVQMGASEIRVIDPDYKRANTMVQELASTLGSCVALVAAESLLDALRDAEGIVNCSPVGMTGGPHGSPVPAELLVNRTLKWAFDIVCYPVETPFVLLAEGAGLTTVRGDAMNLHVRLGMFALLSGIDISELPEGLLGN